MDEPPELGGVDEESIERTFYPEGENGADSDSSEDRLTQLWEKIEQYMLKGQKLQGVETCREVLSCLVKAGKVDRNDLVSREMGGRNSDFPLLCRIYRISFLGDDPRSLLSWQ